MHVLLDLVPGHTSIEHPWFRESAKAAPNELSGRYVWTDSVWTPVGDVPGVNGVLRGVSERDGAVAVTSTPSSPRSITASRKSLSPGKAPWTRPRRSPRARP